MALVSGFEPRSVLCDQTGLGLWLGFELGFEFGLDFGVHIQTSCPGAHQEDEQVAPRSVEGADVNGPLQGGEGLESGRGG